MNRKRSRGKNPWRCSHPHPLRRRRGRATPGGAEDPAVDPEDPNKIRMPETYPHRTMMRTTMKPDPWSPQPTAGSTTRRPFLGCRGKRRRCSTTIARITYVGTRYRHPVLPDDWDMTVEIGIPMSSDPAEHPRRHAPTRRNGHEAAISDAAREALTTLCHAHREDMAITSRRYYPCRSVERLDAWIANPEAEQNPRLESTIEYLATLNTDYNAALDELDMVRYENRKLRAWVAHGVEPAEEEPVEDPADAPRRKKARYNDPEARTYIRHHED
ncbi:hypothetical protein U9M48_017053 [Paspalum notatum var. saurae]|uniref:Uncharacterized protein n=1 Tax=Paspalum notatum var. saurae TaxID=547442 RepID=A0AAQ3T6Z7_PASNO